MEGSPSGDSACSATAQRRLGKWPWPPWNRGTAKAGQRSPQNHGKNDGKHPGGGWFCVGFTTHVIEFSPQGDTYVTVKWVFQEMIEIMQII